jgi:valyl-tRNA synthetase
VSRALRRSLSVFQRLIAPFLPFVAEEVWSWWQEGSVHRASWPTPEELAEALGGARVGEQAVEDEALAVAADVLKEVRKAKSEARRPMRAPVERVVVRDAPARLAALELGAEDLRAAGSIEAIETAEAEEFAVDVVLAEAAP